MSESDLERRRTALDFATGTDAHRLMALFELAEHTDATFDDLISALRFPAPTSTNAAYFLHARLGVPCVDGRAIVDAAYWDDVLRERGIGRAAPYRSVDVRA